MLRQASNLVWWILETAILMKASDRLNSALAWLYRLADRWALLERGVWNGALGGRGAGFGWCIWQYQVTVFPSPAVTRSQPARNAS